MSEYTPADKIMLWRARAAELRFEAAKVTDPARRLRCLNLAANYESLAVAEEARPKISTTLERA